MATVLTHAALPLLVGRALELPQGVSSRRLGVAAVACAVVADLDVATFAFEVRAGEVFGHRGFFHSLLVAAALALVTALLFFRRTPAFGRVWGLLFLSAASHGALDLFTRGEVGVALLAPLSEVRLLSPLRLFPSSPLGVDEVFGVFGAITLLNELLLVVAPVALAAEAVRRARRSLSFRTVTRLTLAWAAVVAGLWLFAPWLYAPTRPRELKSYGAFASDEDLLHIPLAPLPDETLVTNFHALRAQGLFGKRLSPQVSPWSSGFFPAWYGGEAGRWKDGRVALIARTLFGATPPTPEQARSLLASSRAQGLAPTEKYDLAHADYGFSATRLALQGTHNRRPRPRFWFGLCNGVASAGLATPEPFREVEVESPDGHVVLFHPLDVKALLAVAFYTLEDTEVLGGHCEWVDFDPGRSCSMNPGGLTLAVLNHVGLGRQSFLLDVHPAVQSQNYAIASAQVDVTRGPYAPTSEPVEPELSPRLAQLVDVDLSFELSSTMLPVEPSDQPEPADAGHYRRVGLRAVPFAWRATLALDAQGEIIGGRWRGDPANGPDSASFVSDRPMMDAGTALDVNPKIDWRFVKALARASAEEGPGPARLRTADVASR